MRLPATFLSTVGIFVGTADSNAAHCISIKSAAEQAITYLLLLTFRPMTENSEIVPHYGLGDGAYQN